MNRNGVELFLCKSFCRSYLRSLNNSSRIKPKPVGIKAVKRSIAGSWNNQMDVSIESFDTQSQSMETSNGLSSQTIEEFDSDDNSQSFANTSHDSPLPTVKKEVIDDDDLDISDLPDDDVLDKMHVDLAKQTNNLDTTPNLNKIKKEGIVLADEELASTGESFFSEWQNVTSADSEAVERFTNVEVGDLPLVKNEKGEEVLRMYWLDAFEEPIKRPGVVYLFGKVWVESANAHVSCCVTVSNIYRRVFLLPREKKVDIVTNQPTDEEVTQMDVHEEFTKKIAVQHKIFEFKSRFVEKSYAFSIPDIPVKSDYMEVQYPATCARLPENLKGETFSHVFGNPTTALEILLLDRKIKGPCWIDIANPEAVTNPSSWCKIQANCGKPASLTVCPSTVGSPPPLVVVTLSVQTVVNPVKHTNEIVSVSCLVHHEFYMDKPPPSPPYQSHFCCVTRPTDIPWPYNLQLSNYTKTKLEKCDSERALLNFLLVKLHKIDPDLIVGHDLIGYHWDLIVAKCTELKVPNMSRLGRLKRSYGTSDYEKKRRLKEARTGRLICDVKLSAKELIKSRSYDLETLCKDVLHVNESECQELSVADVRKMYASSVGIIQLVERSMQNAAYAIRLMCEMNVMPLALQITTIAGNILSRTLMGGRAERNEFLLLHAFTEKGFIVPDKSFGDTKNQLIPKDGDDDGSTVRKSRNKKPAYAGGLVLEPKKGFYDKYVLLMDFNSLYPSIIQEYNICFTTIASGQEEAILPESGQAPGILPTEIRKLVESRREVKKLMNNVDISPELRLQYNIRQLALKLTANSMYGCLGFKFSRFFAQNLAALVTLKGREILINTKDLVEKMNHEVIYGDTDSLMINTGCTEYDQVFKIGNKIKTEVNRLYRQLELEVDGVFQYLLLLKKKKYAAVAITRLANGSYKTTQEFKGLDIVRRDWSQLSAQAGKFILQQILSELSSDDRIELIHSHLRKLRADLEDGIVPMDLLVITKQLTRAASDYTDYKNLPHVQVAVRMNKETPNKIRQGDTVPYIICTDGTSNSATQRAYHVDEMKANPELKVDVQYYLAQQIQPVISRLCDPIEGTDASRIAECLGLDPKKYAQVKIEQREDDEIVLGEKTRKTAEERFKYCDRFKFTCKNETCRALITMDGAYRTEGSCYALAKCTSPECPVEPVQYISNIQNALTSAIRSHIHTYYMKWLTCEDPACDNRTRRLPIKFQKSFPMCTRCNAFAMYKEYTCGQLYTQICYYQHIFDLSKVTDKNVAKPSPEVDAAYTMLREHVEYVLRHSGYSFIDLTQLFSGIMQVTSK